MSLRKATITIHWGKNESNNETINVLFNPNQYNIHKSNSYKWYPIKGLSGPLHQFLNGEKRTLSMELFFDTYAEQQDVRIYTEKITRIMEIDEEQGKPPRCTFAWGKFSFTGVLEDVSQTFTMFLPSGVPVRATLQVTLSEALSDEEQENIRSNFTEEQMKQYEVLENEDLSTVAHKQYNDPTRWREIADANNIDNPRKVESGTVLVIIVNKG